MEDIQSEIIELDDSVEKLVVEVADTTNFTGKTGCNEDSVPAEDEQVPLEETSMESAAMCEAPSEAIAVDSMIEDVLDVTKDTEKDIHDLGNAKLEDQINTTTNSSSSRTDYDAASEDFPKDVGHVSTTCLSETKFESIVLNTENHDGTTQADITEAETSKVSTEEAIDEGANRILSVPGKDLKLSPLEDSRDNNNGSAKVEGVLKDKQQQLLHGNDNKETKKEPLSVVSLPNDSLHSIASFLTPLEWASYGQCNKRTNKICNNVFRRVRLHGFRCATEVITAWKLDQHADARELCALYIRAGVPIYPRSLGHSYQTLVWRMGIEAKELREQRHSENGEISGFAGRNGQQVTAGNTGDGRNNENTDENDLPPPVDPFFHDRDELRLANEANSTDRIVHVSSTYLEEKAQYTLKNDDDEANVEEIARRLRRQMSFRTPPQLLPPAGVVGQQGPAMPVTFGTPSLLSSRGEWTFGPQSRPGVARSNSFSEFQYRQPKATLKIHRHLVDQHLLGKPAVNDDGGKMETHQINLSADFFHPHFSFQPCTDFCRRGRNGGHQISLQSSLIPSTRDGILLHRNETTAFSDPPGIDNDADRHVPRTTEMLDVHRSSSQLTTDDSESEGEDNTIRPHPIDLNPDNDLTHAANPGLNNPFFPRGGPWAAIDRALANPFFPLESHQRTDCGVFNRRGGFEVLNHVDLDIYSASSSSSKKEDSSDQDLLMSHLKTRFATHQRRLEKSLTSRDSDCFEEIMLDLWDEFLPKTAMIQYYDGHTAVPRLSCLQKFLSRPCPKSVGIIQCEIERIKISPKKKGVNMKGRFFPTYEYRLFIRDRRSDQNRDNEEEGHSVEDDTKSRRDMVLMMAKNRERKTNEFSGKQSSSFSSKKGANSYYIYLPQQEDVDHHFRAANGHISSQSPAPNGAADLGPLNDSPLLCRLQSNFIGTEFQIFTPRMLESKPSSLRSTRAHRSMRPEIAHDDDGIVIEEEDADFIHSASSPRGNRFSRLSLRGRSRSRDGEALQPSDPPNPSPLLLRRSRSSGEVTSVRKSLLSRRVSAADAVEPKHVTEDIGPVFFEEEDGAITYTANLLGSRPRIMDVCIPKVDSDGVGTEWKKYVDHCESTDTSITTNRMLNNLKQLQQRGDADDWTGINTAQNSTSGNTQEQSQSGEYVPPDDYGLLSLQNRPPWWNVELGSFVLNFGGRVSVASVKNFQLCDRTDQDYIMLQFGRIQGRHSFTMDFQYPLTGVQAFAIAISSLQSKISFG